MESGPYDELLDMIEDKDLSAYCRSRNIVSIVNDLRALHQLDRLDWKNDSDCGFAVEVEKGRNIGRAKGSDIRKVVEEAVSKMNGSWVEKPPNPILTAKPSFWKKIFG